MINKKVELIDFPVQWVPLTWRKNYDISLLKIGDKCEVLEGLSNLVKKDERDFKKLLATIRLQLETKGLIKNKKNEPALI